jgi:GrpB-like predicted nucleotidyltransferase (UPF0157 family)
LPGRRRGAPPEGTFPPGNDLRTAPSGLKTRAERECQCSAARGYAQPVADVRIAIVPYDPAWPRRFEVERALLEPVLASWLQGGIHHVGSTAVPGIAAKPIIDMIAGVCDLEGARAAFESLREHSYDHTPHRPGIAHHFDKRSRQSSQPTHGRHLTEPESDLWRERLAFRDALRDDPALVAEYERLKLRLAKEHGTDVAAYTAGKRAFVARVLATVGIQPGRR